MSTPLRLRPSFPPPLLHPPPPAPPILLSRLLRACRCASRSPSASFVAKGAVRWRSPRRASPHLSAAVHGVRLVGFSIDNLSQAQSGSALRLGGPFALLLRRGHLRPRHRRRHRPPSPLGYELVVERGLNLQLDVREAEEVVRQRLAAREPCVGVTQLVEERMSARAWMGGVRGVVRSGEGGQRDAWVEEGPSPRYVRWVVGFPPEESGREVTCQALG